MASPLSFCPGWILELIRPDGPLSRTHKSFYPRGGGGAVVPRGRLKGEDGSHAGLAS